MYLPMYNNKMNNNNIKDISTYFNIFQNITSDKGIENVYV